MNTGRHRLKKSNKSVSLRVCLSIFFLVLFASACSQFEKPKPEPFYAETAPPQIKEFRWSNGRLPKSFDPAKASAPPETDVVRAVYEGLTDTNAKTLETVPAIAAAWSMVDDDRTWTFKLRRDARWSNGERLTAQDFARSWRRLAALGDKVPHFQLLGNIAGMQAVSDKIDRSKKSDELSLLENKSFNQNFPSIFKPAPDGKAIERQPDDTKKNTVETTSPSADNNRTPTAAAAAEPEEKAATESKLSASAGAEPKFGVEAIDDSTLKVSLIKPDKDFPALVAHPVFRPVYGDGKYFESGRLNADIVTSGAFRVASASASGILLERSEYFWNKNQIELERVRFVPMESAEAALAAYRAGELEAVTNIDFEPLALKLLTPFDDFRRTPHSALNFYEFNRSKPPFDDQRVREALSVSIERERLTEDVMDGASVPAFGFSPFNAGKETKLKQDAERARTLLTEAGFAGGENFPAVRLVINRNNMQQRIARAVAKMWKQNLNVETEIIVKDPTEFDAARQTGDFDVLRRGVVLPTTDETVNMLAIFAPETRSEKAVAEENNFADQEKTVEEEKTTDAANQADKAAISPNAGTQIPAPRNQPNVDSAITADKIAAAPAISSEYEAVFQINAIPLYFPTAYSLVKPYVQGFEINSLDAPSLKDVRIDNNWQPKKAQNES